MARYLTKSRFKLGLECPTKLYYDGKKEYANQKLEDTFLQSLAHGGYQVGELAKLYYPGGIEVESASHDEAVRITDELLQRDEVVIFEAAMRSGDLFVRADILVKYKDQIELIEVKAKSIDPASDSFLLQRGGGIKSDWKPYLYDVAFQKHVTRLAYPEFKVRAILMLADKSAICGTDGLNQKFRIIKDQRGRSSVVVSSDLTDEDLQQHLLIKLDVDQIANSIYLDPIEHGSRSYEFQEFVSYLASRYVNDVMIPPCPSSICRKCEFRTTAQEKEHGLNNGFEECWSSVFGWGEADFKRQSVLNLWNFRKIDKLITEGRIRLIDVEQEDLNLTPKAEPGLTAGERQWMQVLKEKEGDPSSYFDRDQIKREMEQWVFPLHFIDFETSMAAIPFHRGHHPYEPIAFQFSHHLVHEDGRVEHRGQYLNSTPGMFPNFDFVRSLREELEQDQGSIFRYATHENSYLNNICRQLQSRKEEVEDAEELCSFIRSITRNSDSKEGWAGPRNMIDLCVLVKKYYFDPATKGSNSIKYVLPAILNRSEYLKEKYSQPIYGAEGGIASLNYRNWTWVELDPAGRVKDPYKLLPRMFRDFDGDKLDLLMDGDELREGGAAATAYAKMQFEDMSAYEREEISQALLKYCELDTLAMVMLYEGWRDLS